MTPAARVQAAIDVLEVIGDGQAAEAALTRWARRSRYAGSKDRAAVRDHVFEVLRIKRTAAALGGGESARALMIGALRHAGLSVPEYFTGIGHAPPPLSVDEEGFTPASPERNVRWNLPDWLAEAFERSLGPDAEATAMALQARAPVCLRVNLRRGDLRAAQQALLAEQIETVPVAGVETALRVTEGARRVRNSAAFAQGLVELQDAHSQALVAELPAASRVLDYCAGGGGKALALADRPGTEVFAFDRNQSRMADIPARAHRAGVSIKVLASQAEVTRAAPFDAVLCDAPCTGSGAWRRTPDAKWKTTPARLSELNDIQDHILREASRLVAPAGTLAYATCSVLAAENEARVQNFLDENPVWTCTGQTRLPVNADGDGFFVALLNR